MGKGENIFGSCKVGGHAYITWKKAQIVQRTRIEATTRYIWVEGKALAEGNEAKWEEERVWKTTAHVILQCQSKIPAAYGGFVKSSFLF